MTKEKTKKSGMYGEMPIIKIGEYSMSLMSNDKGEDRVWIKRESGEASEFPCSLLEPYIKDFYDKHF